ncbi:heat shock transcription factor [Penicillium brasilianum]|uniref:Heat shock transcription factor n=1 Tax=Penicillium brasilianum TaxID=104259 RepID=A0A1S9RTV1_PENBI|nr:heat shock transcription factor [Penicillium brasilianum]
MNSQGITRKRPAPGTTPAVQHQLGNYPNPTPNSQLSNDQFLQWGQNPPANVANASFVDPSAYNSAAYASSQDLSGPAASTSNQLTRRPQPNQLVSRNRGYEQAPATYSDNTAGANNGEGAWGESIEELYNRALAAKREAQAKRKQIPPFVQKLSSFLDGAKNTELIRWSDDGNSFIVLDEDEFARRLIPELFKHNNYASFVRQLNMYGFHKKVGLSDNSMRASERKNKSPSEYSNPYFKRGHPELLWLISKPKNATGHASKGSKGGARVKTEDADDNELDDYEEGGFGARDDRARPRPLSLLTDSEMPKDQLEGVVQQLKAIRHQQSVISSHIASLRREHEQLSAQAATFQDQHTRHENSINAILTFLATVYNRSLQGQDGSQNIANSFAGAISSDHPGNIVDVGDDFSFSPLASMTSPTGQRMMKKQPLLLKAPPTVNGGNRATTLSPAASGTYDTRSRSHTRQPSVSQPGHVEEVLDSSPRQGPTNVSAGQVPDEKYPQKDIMSVIQNSNARNASPTTFSQFPDVLSSLERGGNGPLTPGVRADMLRLMANDTGHHSDSPGSNNALVMPNPPPMPQDYSTRLSNTRQEIDSLVKLQAEQDRSVQNLTNLLQPLSPTGAIPGLDNDANAPPPIDLDQIFNNDYFTDLGDTSGADQKHDPSTLDFGTGTNPHDTLATTQPDAGDTNDLLDFGHMPGDDDLFNSNQGPTNSSYNYGFDGTGYGVDAGSGNFDSGRIVEQLTDSEATSPAAADDPSVETEDGGSAVKRRRKA